MKKFFKILTISLTSVIALLVIVISIVLWIVVTPEKLTPIVREQAAKFVTCQVDIDTVDVTFFSSFPDVCLRINGLRLINPMAGAPDTLVCVDECSMKVDLGEYFSNKVVLNEFKLKRGFVNVFADSCGHANYDVFPLDTTTTEAVSATASGSFENPYDIIKLEAIHADGVRLYYKDKSLQLVTELNETSLKLNASMVGEILKGDINAQMDSLSFNMGSLLQLETSELLFSTPFEYDLNKGKIDVTISSAFADVFFKLEKDIYISKATIKMDAPMTMLMEPMTFSFRDAICSVNDFETHLDGSVVLDTVDMRFDLGYKLNEWQIKPALAMVPATYASMLKDISIDGVLSVSGKMQGILNDSLLPQISTDVIWKEGTFAYAEFPKYKFRNINADVNTLIDLNKGAESSVTINQFSGNTGSNYIAVKGSVNDLLESLRCNLSADLNLKLEEFQSFIPEDLKTKIVGRAKGNVGAQFTLDQIMDLKLEKMRMNADLLFSDLNVVYDSMNVETANTRVKFKMPGDTKPFKQLMNVGIKTDGLYFEQGISLHTVLGASNLAIGLSDYRDTSKLISAKCDFDIADISFVMDSLKAMVKKPKGSFVMTPSKDRSMDPLLNIKWNSDSIFTTTGADMTLSMNGLAFSGQVESDPQQTDIMRQWNPQANINMKNCIVELADLKENIEVPSIFLELTPERFYITDSRVNLGNSDFSLAGEVKNIDAFLKNKGLLMGEIDLTSHLTDVNQLMDLVSGMGSSPTDTIVETQTVELDSTANPFIVPKGVDLAIRTKIDTVIVGKQKPKNLGGKLYIKDGIMVLEEMGFVCDAARLQLTAIYRSPRPNHLYVGLNYHMVDIQIAELLDMIPQIDTLLPMMSSFAGQAEFHLAAETYLDRFYHLKNSTVRGAASISGKDLVLMDNDMFSTISKVLMFNKKTENKIDSVSVEMTAFKDEVDIYPFTISMDKYQAVVGGQQNIDDFSYNYHVSLLKSPLPVRLGCDIIGNTEDFNVNLVKCKYAENYKPVIRNVTDNQKVSLKKKIKEALENASDL